jgi:hypothetical protein
MVICFNVKKKNGNWRKENWKEESILGL